MVNDLLYLISSFFHSPLFYAAFGVIESAFLTNFSPIFLKTHFLAKKPRLRVQLIVSQRTYLVNENL